MEQTKHITVGLFESDEQCLKLICDYESIEPQSLSWLIRHIIRQYLMCIQTIPYDKLPHQLTHDPNYISPCQRQLIGERIHQLRQSRRMSLKEFGSLFNVSKQMVMKWERGSCPRENILDEMATQFNVKKEWIKGEKNNVK